MYVEKVVVCCITNCIIRFCAPIGFDLMVVVKVTLQDCASNLLTLQSNLTLD